MPEGDLDNLKNVPSWGQYAIGCQSLVVAQEDEDVEDTLMVQLTVTEVAMVSLGIILLERMFPEMRQMAERFGLKIQELAKVQEYFSGDDDDDGA